MRRLGRRGAAVLAAAVIATGGGVVAAAESETGTTIHGCYNKSTGALRVLESGASCRSAEQPISWNETGPAGAQGPTGPQGPVGPQGEQGPAGPSGAATPASRWYADRDGDGFGDWYDRIDSAGQPAGFVSNNDDCNDDNANVHPGGGDVGVGWDFDCDGVANDIAVEWFPDNDGDGVGVSEGSRSGFTGRPVGYSLHQHDCDDTNPSARNWGCDNFQRWCDDPEVSEGHCHTNQPDADGDGHYAAGPGGGDDCNDASGSVYAGAIEVRYDGLDNDCDPATRDVEARVEDAGRHDPLVWGQRSP